MISPLPSTSGGQPALRSRYQRFRKNRGPSTKSWYLLGTTGANLGATGIVGIVPRVASKSLRRTVTNSCSLVPHPGHQGPCHWQYSDTPGPRVVFGRVYHDGSHDNRLGIPRDVEEGLEKGGRASVAKVSVPRLSWYRVPDNNVRESKNRVLGVLQVVVVVLARSNTVTSITVISSPSTSIGNHHDDRTIPRYRVQVPPNLGGAVPPRLCSGYFFKVPGLGIPSVATRGRAFASGLGFEFLPVLQVVFNSKTNFIIFYSVPSLRYFQAIPG